MSHFPGPTSPSPDAKGDHRHREVRVAKRHRRQMAVDKVTTHREWWECSACGEEVDAKDNFCSSCGKKFG